MRSDNDAPAPETPGPGSTPVLVWVVIAILVAIGVAITVGERRVEASVAVIVFLVAAGLAVSPSRSAAGLEPSRPPVRRPVSSTLTVFVVRHGRTALNADGRLRWHLDVDLDGAGRFEAARLANTFARVPLTRIVSSPLLRARQTAAPVAAVLDLAVEPDSGFIDRDYGEWAGKSVIEIEQRFGVLDAAPGVEPSATFEQRIVDSFLRVLAERPSDDPMLIVGHDATNQALLRAIVPAVGALGDVAQHTGCWNRVDLVDGVWHATAVNRIPTDTTPPIVL